MRSFFRRSVRAGVVLALAGGGLAALISWRDRRAAAARARDEAAFARASTGIWPAVARRPDASVVIDGATSATGHESLAEDEKN